VDFIMPYELATFLIFALRAIFIFDDTCLRRYFVKQISFENRAAKVRSFFGKTIDGENFFCFSN